MIAFENILNAFENVVRTTYNVICKYRRGKYHYFYIDKFLFISVTYIHSLSTKLKDNTIRCTEISNEFMDLITV